MIRALATSLLFFALSAQADVQTTVYQIRATHDNMGLPFLVVDKVDARVYAFSPAGMFLGEAPVLVGMAKGDHLLVKNDTPMSAMSPEVRITPAGRFLSRLWIDSHGKELLVLDYEAAISLHPVVKGKPEEHRAERLASPTSVDNRISYGCINVPPEFYTKYVHTAFEHMGVVYVLPEMTN
jgi:hypothetical protein